MTRYARFASSGSGRVTSAEADCLVWERSDRQNGARQTILYGHTSLDDWNLPARNPAFVGVPGTGAVLTTVLDYALASRKFSIIASEFKHGSTGVLTPYNAWGNDVSVTKMTAAVFYAATLPGSAGAGGMGARAGKILGVGYSHGGSLILNLCRANPALFAGILLFHPAINLSQLRGTDAAQGGFYQSINEAYLDDTHNPNPGSVVNDTRWNTIKLTHDPSLFNWSSLSGLPPVLDFVSNDDATLGQIAGIQDVFPAAYGRQCQMVTLPSGDGGHFSGTFANEPYATQIHQFIDGLNFG